MADTVKTLPEVLREAAQASQIVHGSFRWLDVAAAAQAHHQAHIDSLTRSLELARTQAIYRKNNDRICYRGYSYGMNSQDGIDDLQKAIERNGHG